MILAIIIHATLRNPVWDGIPGWAQMQACGVERRPHSKGPERFRTGVCVIDQVRFRGALR